MAEPKARPSIAPIAATVLLAAFSIAQTRGEPTTAPTDQRSRVKTYTFKKTEQADLKIHVHFPPNWKPQDQRPAIVFFFGGGWTNGTTRQFEPQATYLARRGMVAARADYRVFSRHKVAPDKCVEDALSAVCWLRKNAEQLGIDPDRIVASGGSAGGHLAACTAMVEDLKIKDQDYSVCAKPNALVLFNPVLDTTHESIVKRLGGNEELARKISPYHNLKKNGPPTLIMFGSDDRFIAMVPPFMARAKELGNKVELYTADKAVHGFFNRSPWYERTLLRTDQFLTEIGCLSDDPDLTKWAKHYYARVALFQTKSVKAKGIVLVGSSHIEGFDTARHLPGRRFVNRGIIADRIGITDRGVLRRLDSSVFNCDPSFIILENGVNDLGELWRHGTPSIDQIDECYRKVVKTIRSRLPEVPLVIVGLFPTRDTYAPLVPHIVEFNRRLEKLAADFNCPFMDVYEPFADDKGLLKTEYSREGLHLTDVGYKQWAQLIEPILPPAKTRPEPSAEEG